MSYQEELKAATDAVFIDGNPEPLIKILMNAAALGSITVEEALSMMFKFGENYGQNTQIARQLAELKSEQAAVAVQEEEP